MEAHRPIANVIHMSIQGAFGDSMRPSLQGLLGREKLPAVLMPGMKDDIYSLSGLLSWILHTRMSQLDTAYKQ